jgi:hypothetical protein
MMARVVEVQFEAKKGINRIVRMNRIKEKAKVKRKKVKTKETALLL